MVGGKIGRPRNTNPRTISVGCMMTREEYDVVRWNADRLGVTVGKFLRVVAVRVSEGVKLEIETAPEGMYE